MVVEALTHAASQHLKGAVVALILAPLFVGLAYAMRRSAGLAILLVFCALVAAITAIVEFGSM